jgi:hypothetical protein
VRPVAAHWRGSCKEAGGYTGDCLGAVRRQVSEIGFIWVCWPPSDGKTPHFLCHTTPALHAASATASLMWMAERFAQKLRLSLTCRGCRVNHHLSVAAQRAGWPNTLPAHMAASYCKIHA